nr:peptidoglycan-binding protein [Bacillus marinisedimentorum]
MLKSLVKEKVVIPTITVGMMLSAPHAASGSTGSGNPARDSAMNIQQHLKFGQTGNSVKKLQLALKGKHIYNLSADGIFGPATLKAVKTFQKKQRLSVDGIAGPNTLETLFINSAAVPYKYSFTKTNSVQYGDRGEKVRSLQNKLMKLKYYTGNLDGVFGPLTKKAVIQFQTEKNLKVDGIAGPQVYGSLSKHKSWQTEVTVKPAPPTAKVKIEDKKRSAQFGVAKAARRYIGTPYRWGGTTPAGFDCSGFLKHVFAKQGVNIPRTVSDIWNFGTDVTKPSVGDILFFQTYKPGPSHAGIYLGDGKFIHAGSSKGVTVSKLDTSYWKSRYLGTKRMIQHN